MRAPMNAMTAFALILYAVLAGACEEEKETPAQAQLKAECRRLEEHLVQITPAPGSAAPETDPARIRELVARVPIEDIEQCAAVKDRKVIACMLAAHDAAGLKACIPAQTE
jgi:alpha-glucuronidase